MFKLVPFNKTGYLSIQLKYNLNATFQDLFIDSLGNSNIRNSNANFHVKSLITKF